MALALHGLGHFHPEVEISNRFLEELDIGTSEAWILERTGIRSRRTVLPLDYIRWTRNRDPRAAAEAALYDHAELGRRAAELALARAGLEPDQVGLVLAGSSAPETTAPAEACRVAAALGIEAPALDLHSACTSFFAALWLLAKMQPAALPDFVLVVAIDSLTRTVHYEDRASAVLWGDGAAAAVLSPRVPGRAAVLGLALGSDPSQAERVVVPRVGHFRQDGRAVHAFAIRRSASELERLRGEVAKPERALHFVGHQANLRMLEAVCRRCGIASERHHANVAWFGNTGCPSAVSVLSQRWERWGEEDDVAVVTVGAGLTWARCLLRFGPRMAGTSY